MTSKSLPSSITAYDLLKTFAVIVMVIDHFGVYIFPDQDWWRAIGRIQFPVWFFLVGFARERSIPKEFIIGALVLMVADLIVGRHILPLNTLVTIALIRVSIDKLMALCKMRPLYLWLGATLMFLLAIPSGIFLEYGAQGMLVAMLGYMVRNSIDFPDKNKRLNFMLFSFLSFIFYQQMIFGFSTFAFAFMCVGTFLVLYSLLTFDGRAYPELTAKMPPLLTSAVQFCGRHTLEIYVAHLVVFKFIALLLGHNDLHLFTFHLMSEDLLNELRQFSGYK